MAQGSARGAAPKVTARINANGPLFKGESHPQAAYKHNEAWAVKGPYQTSLAPKKEERFQDWAKRYEGRQGIKVNKEYDYRGWWKNASQAERHGAIAKGGHFTDLYKTPYDTSFSNQSKYAKPGTPLVWRQNANGKNVLVNRKNGRLILRESEE
jgi:hypothetical protein